MTDIITKAICDSERNDSDSSNSRLLTMFCRAPQMIHQETLRHRKLYIQDNLAFDPDFSFSVSSSRAIPTKNLLQEARTPSLQAKPVFWGSEQRGMTPGPEHNELIKNTLWYQFSPKEYLTREELWEIQARQNTDIAEAYLEAGYHKSIANRIINHNLHTNCLMTATNPGWLNFFGLRLDSAADPILRALAEACWKVFNESIPNKLQPGLWHLPYVDNGTIGSCFEYIAKELKTNRLDRDQKQEAINLMIKVSVARCARLSYQSFETQKRSTIEEDLKLYQRLVGSYPIHASPAEHQATPDEMKPFISDGDIWPETWSKPHLSGNLGPGWIQYRKLLPKESIAPLPEGY